MKSIRINLLLKKLLAPVDGNLKTEATITIVSILIMNYLTIHNVNTFLLRFILLVHGIRSLSNLFINVYKDDCKQKKTLPKIIDDENHTKNGLKRLRLKNWKIISLYTYIYWLCILSSLPTVLLDIGISGIFTKSILFITIGFLFTSIFYFLRIDYSLQTRHKPFYQNYAKNKLNPYG